MSAARRGTPALATLPLVLALWAGCGAPEPPPPLAVSLQGHMWLEPDGDGGWTPVARAGEGLVVLVERDGSPRSPLPDDLTLVAWLEHAGGVVAAGAAEAVDGRLAAALDPWAAIEDPGEELAATVRVAAWRGDYRGASARLDEPLAAGVAPDRTRLPAPVAVAERPVLLVPRGWRYRGCSEAVRACRAAYKTGEDDPVASCEQAAARAEAGGAPRDRMLALGLLGAAHARAGRLDAARAAFEDSADAAAAVPGGLPAEQTRSLRRAAGAALDGGAYLDGLALAEQALAIDAEHHHLRAELRDRNLLADVAYRLGDPTRCIAEFRDALAQARLLQSDWEEFNTLVWLGTRYHDIGRYGAALRCFAEAEPLLAFGPDAPPHVRQARSVYLTDLGWAQLKARRRGLLEVPAGDVRRQFEDALAINAEQDDLLWEANTRMNLAELAIQEAEYAEAHRQLEQVRALLDRAPAFEHASYLLALEGELALAEGEAASALRTYDALAAAEGRWAASWWADYGRARAWTALGRDREAIEAYERALAALEGAAARMDPLTDRSYFLGDRDEVYDRYLLLMLDRGHPWAAFEIGERSRDRAAAAARALPSTAGAGDAADPALLEALLDARAALQAHEADEDFVHPDRRRRWEHRREALVARLVGAQAALAGSLRTDDEGAAVSLEGLRQALGDDPLVLYYHVTSEELVLLAVRSSGTSVHRTAMPRARLQELVSRHVEAIRDGDGTSPDPALAEALLPTDLALRGDELLIVIPHGPLHALPFATLRRDGRALVETHPLALAPSAAALLAPSAATHGGDGGAVVAADPGGDLQGARDEGRAVAALLGVAEPLQGDEVRAAALREALATASTVHYAGHAVVDADLPQHSHLRLAGGERLTWMDLQAMPVGSSLVVLSGCETGRAVRPAAGEAWGLATALLHAGAGAVLAAAWEVPDRPTAEVMQRFHQERTTAPAPEALRRVQRAAIAGELGEDAAAPGAWAAFSIHAHLDALR